MPPNDTPLNKAHQHASNAEDYINRGLLVSAAEEHYQSAEAFLQCVEQAGDDGTKRTLRMLYNEHSKSWKELQRKIAKLKEEGKDPSLPQITRTPIPTERRRVSPGLLTGTPAASSSYSNPRSRLSDSHHTIDESYMFLGQQSDHTFNEFWKVFEGMLDNLSQPVAFATAPLALPKSAELVHKQPQNLESSPDKRSVPQDQSFSGDETNLRVGVIPMRDGRTLGIQQPGREGQPYMSDIALKPHEDHFQEAMQRTIVPNRPEVPENSDPEEVLADPDSPSGESFFMIPSASGSSNARLQQENASLKCEIESLRQRLNLAEQLRLEQEQQVREGISQARREAQRVMNSTYLPQRTMQPPVDLSALNINVPPVPTFPKLTVNRDREAQLIRKVKELEEEIQTVRAENEKQKAMIVKFRERWEKLKESAKRKRNAKANAGLESVREQRIDEEPELEPEVAAEPEVN